MIIKRLDYKKTLTSSGRALCTVGASQCLWPHSYLVFKHYFKQREIISPMGSLVVPVTRAESFLWHTHTVSKRVPVTQLPALELAARAIKPVYTLIPSIINGRRESSLENNSAPWEGSGMYLVLKVELNNFLTQDFLSSCSILHAESQSPLINCSGPAHTITNQTPGPESKH